jgi:pentatricopeptide repeat protein
MKLSRRYRVGVVRPSSITYARAIAVCGKAENPDIETARFFLASARDDDIEPTVFMYSAAIWTAERSGDYKAAIEILCEMQSLNNIQANTICYNGVLSALAQHGRDGEALALYEEMRENNCVPTVSTYNVSCSSRASGHVSTPDLIKLPSIRHSQLLSETPL